jgi:hypothetical protein
VGLGHQILESLSYESARGVGGALATVSKAIDHSLDCRLGVAAAFGVEAHAFAAHEER